MIAERGGWGIYDKRVFRECTSDGANRNQVGRRAEPKT